MKVRVVCKYCKSEKNATVISSERHSDDSGQGALITILAYLIVCLRKQMPVGITKDTQK